MAPRGVSAVAFLDPNHQLSGRGSLRARGRLQLICISLGGNTSTNERGDGHQVPAGDCQLMGLQTSSAPEWPWPAELDALAAAPQHHTLLLENERVRVLDTRIGPGELVPVHTHRWPSVLYVLSWSAFIRRDAQGTVLLDSRSAPGLAQPASVLWSEALPPHSLENVGSSEIRIISVELKQVAA